MYLKKKYTGCNLKNKNLLDCALIGVDAVIRLNVVVTFFYSHGHRPGNLRVCHCSESFL